MRTFLGVTFCTLFAFSGCTAREANAIQAGAALLGLFGSQHGGQESDETHSRDAQPRVRDYASSPTPSSSYEVSPKTGRERRIERREERRDSRHERREERRENRFERQEARRERRFERQEARRERWFGSI